MKPTQSPVMGHHFACAVRKTVIAKLGTEKNRLERWTDCT